MTTIREALVDVLRKRPFRQFECYPIDVGNVGHWICTDRSGREIDMRLHRDDLEVSVLSPWEFSKTERIPLTNETKILKILLVLSNIKEARGTLPLTDAIEKMQLIQARGR